MANSLATTNDGGVSNLAVGSFTGDGTATVCTTGFLPRMVKIINITDLTTYEITSNMVAGNALKAISTGVLTNDVSGITLSGTTSASGVRGFTIPAAIAIAGKVIQYYAFG